MRSAAEELQTLAVARALQKHLHQSCSLMLMLQALCLVAPPQFGERSRPAVRTPGCQHVSIMLLAEGHTTSVPAALPELHQLPEVLPGGAGSVQRVLGEGRSRAVVD